MKTILVIGEGAARDLADAGCREISALNSETEHHECAYGTFVHGVFTSLDRLDGLVNGAGVLRRGAEYDITVFQHMHVTGTMRCLPGGRRETCDLRRTK